MGRTPQTEWPDDEPVRRTPLSIAGDILLFPVIVAVGLFGGSVFTYFGILLFALVLAPLGWLVGMVAGFTFKEYIEGSAHLAYYVSVAGLFIGGVMGVAQGLARVARGASD